MILKGNIRANGAELARHLLNDRHEIDPAASFQPPTLGNERVEVAELRGFASQDLAGAFGEIEAIAAGTRSTKPLYSLSINPSEKMSRDQYGHAIEAIEKKLGLDDQARAVVFHTKNGREHCHVVWSRIDLEKMQARHMEFDHQKLRETARDLVCAFGHEMPRHLGEDRGAERFKDRFNAVNLAEQGQARRSGLSPEDRRKQITEAYRQSDNAPAFQAALREQGFILATGEKTDRKGNPTLVVVDKAGEVHGLNRQIEGAKAKEIAAKLNLEDLRGDLPTHQQAKDQHAKTLADNAQQAAQKPQERPHPIDRLKGAEKTLSAVRGAYIAQKKAVQGNYADTLKELKKQEGDRVKDARARVREAYRPDWRDLYRKQGAELEALKAQSATAGKRLKMLLTGRAGDAFDFENRNTLAGAFHFVANGGRDFSKMGKRHTAEREQLGDLHKVALATEIRAIRAETASERKTARQDYTETLSRLGRDHSIDRQEAEREYRKAKAAAVLEKRKINTATLPNEQGRPWSMQKAEQRQKPAPAFTKAQNDNAAELSKAQARAEPTKPDALRQLRERNSAIEQQAREQQKKQAALTRQEQRTEPKRDPKQDQQAKPARPPQKPQQSRQSEAEQNLARSRGDIDHSGEKTRQRPSSSKLVDAFFATFSDEENKSAADRAKDQAKKEREQEKSRGLGGGRTRGR